MSSHRNLANYLYRAVSLLVGTTILAVPIAWVFRARLDLRRLKQLSIVSLIWLASISTAVLSHTLDQWRYVASATPLAVLIIALGMTLLTNIGRRAMPKPA